VVGRLDLAKSGFSLDEETQVVPVVYSEENFLKQNNDRGDVKPTEVVLDILLLSQGKDKFELDCH